MSSKLSLPTEHVLGISVTALSFDDQMQTILNCAKRGESRTVCVANVHMLVEAHSDVDFAKVLDNADVITPDGMPLVWMMRQRGLHTQDRVAGLDIILALCKLAQLHNVSVFFVGSQTEILKRMRTRLDREFPQLQIAGMEPLPFRPLTPDEDEAIMKQINDSGAGLVFVSLGCPKQERWMDQHKGKIQAVMIGLGGAFPVYAGLKKRAPAWIRNIGLEWLYRLGQEPRRLASRYWVTNIAFLWMLIKQSLKYNSSGVCRE